MWKLFALCSTQADARRGRLDVVAAAILNGGASGGWLMERALRL